MRKNPDDQNSNGVGALVAICIVLFIALIVGAHMLGKELKALKDELFLSFLSGGVFIGTASAAEGNPAVPHPMPSQGGPCGPTADVFRQLGGEKYKEKLREGGLGSDGTFVVFTVSPDGSTWTLVQVYPNGTACIRAAGENFQNLKKEEPGSDM